MELMKSNRETREIVGAGILAALGIVATSVGAFAHVPQLAAPGSTAILVGGAWLGSALARTDLSLPRRSTANRAPKTGD